MVKSATVMLILALLLAASSGTVVTHCIKTCSGISNGDYNSCDGCAEFITCSEGTLSKTPCNPGTLFDADRGFCDWTSNTCTESVSTRHPADTTVAETTSQPLTSERTDPVNNPSTPSSLAAQTTTSQTNDTAISGPTSSLTSQVSSLAAQTTTSQTNDTDISGPTSSLTSQVSSLAVQTTESQTYDYEMSSLANSPTIHSNSSETATRASQSIANETVSSQSSPTVTTGFTHPQTFKTQTTDSHSPVSISTVQPGSTSAIAQTTASPADVRTFHYVRVHYEIAPCVTDTGVLGSVPTRSKIECGSVCKRSTKCGYFQHTAQQCLMYERTSPPCSIIIYRYDGDGVGVGVGGGGGGRGVDENDVGGDGEGGASDAEGND